MQPLVIFFKNIGIEFPITSFRLANMMTGAEYPIEKIKEVVGSLPYSLTDGVRETIIWMKSKELIK